MFSFSSLHVDLATTLWKECDSIIKNKVEKHQQTICSCRPELNWTEPTCEAALALLLAAGDGEELVGEQVEGGGTPVRVGLEAAQDEGFGLQRHGLWDLWVDLKHTHLQTQDTRSVQRDTQKFKITEKPRAHRLLKHSLRCPAPRLNIWFEETS